MSAIRDLCEHDGTVEGVEGGRSFVGSEIGSNSMNSSIRSQFGRNPGRPGLARTDAGLDSLLGGDASITGDSFHADGGNSFEIDSLGASQHSALGGYTNHSAQRAKSLMPSFLSRGHSDGRANTLDRRSTGIGLGNPQTPYTKSGQSALQQPGLSRGGSLGGSMHGGSPSPLAQSLHGGLGGGLGGGFGGLGGGPPTQSNAAAMALKRRESVAVLPAGGKSSRRGSLSQSLHGGGGNAASSLHGGMEGMWPKSGPLGPLANANRKGKRQSTMLQKQQSHRRTLRNKKSNHQPLTEEDGNESVLSLTNGKQDVPYFEKLCQICEEIEYPFEYADIVGSQFLGLDGASPVTHVEGHVPTINELVDFLSQAFICITNYSDLSLIFVDDFQWVDSFTWKIFRELCEKGKKMLLICAMRSHDKQALRRLSAAITQSHMQSQMIEISLGPLDLLEIREMIAKVLGYGEDAVDESLCSDIYQKTGGLPVYVAELLENIKRNKTVAIDDSGILRWTAQAEQEQVRECFC